MENIGEIVKEEERKLFFRTAVGIGGYKEEKFELSISMQNNPIVEFKNNYFILSWQDIIALAEKAGLFDLSDFK